MAVPPRTEFRLYTAGADRRIAEVLVSTWMLSSSERELARVTSSRSDVIG
jgi:hypothetical protein